MQAIILCGGLGTRLREETEFKPKSMVSIGNRPIIWHIMKIYSRFGVKDFILCLGYKGEMIKDYFNHYELLNNDLTIEIGHQQRTTIIHNHNDEDGWRITLADTGDNALKGARLKKIEKYIEGDEFMVTYGDGVADVDINKLLRYHRDHGKLATVTGVNPSSRFGELRIRGNHVRAFNEKPSISRDFINGGFFIFKRRIFDYLSADDDCDLEVGPLERIAREGQLMVYKHEGMWACMDTLRDMDYLNKLWNNDRAFWKIWQ
jgi:glucose-1-phosphate cytidylyltransferase